MAGNSFGTLFKLISFGESHGAAIGGVLEGFPAGVKIDPDFIQQELNRRKPGQSEITTSRNENDSVEILSGVFEGISTGTPIGFMIRNNDHHPADYTHIQNAYRPSHADFTWQTKFGIRDYRGGGRSSARETAARVVAGALAKLLLSHLQLEITAYVSAVADIEVPYPYHQLDLKKTESNIVRCPDESTAKKMIAGIEAAKNNGDSLGGVITCVIRNAPAGWGQPVFDKFHAMLAHAMLSINAVKGFEYGSGFDGTRLKGSEHNDEFFVDNKTVKTKTNFSGGVQGGITNGEDIYFRVAFKPVATIMKTQKSIDTAGNKIQLEAKGRHDPCVLPRAVPIVEAMAAMVCADFYLLNRNSKI